MTGKIPWPNGRQDPGSVWWEFGPRTPLWTPEGYTSNFHGGIDLGPWDDKGGKSLLLAPLDSNVSLVGFDNIFGNRVVLSVSVNNNRYDLWLCHGRTGSTLVKAGESVRRGQGLMLMGETGKADGRHLHYEVHENGTRINPRRFHDLLIPSTNQEEEENMIVNIQGQEHVQSGGAYHVTATTARFLGATVAGVPNLDKDQGRTLLRGKTLS